MAKYEQGTAPAVVFENGKVVFVFRKKTTVKEQAYQKIKKQSYTQTM